jgi:UDP-galactose transporter
MKQVLYPVLFLLGACGYAGVGIFSQLSKDPTTGTYRFNMPSVILGSEICKLLMSSMFLSQEEGSVNACIKKVWNMPRRTLLFFSVPSIIYAVGNNLDMVCNRFMDSATFQVCSQLKILFTALLWSFVFKESLGLRKWVALVCLLLGGAAASWPSGESEEDKSRLEHMYITNLGVLSIIAYASCGASAGIATEGIYKSIGAAESIHLQNIAMYSVGVVTIFILFVLSRKETTNFLDVFEGFNFWTWCLMLNFCSLGLLSSFIMKYLDNIQKLLMSGASMYVSATFTTFILGLQPTQNFIFGLLVVTSGLVIFNWDKLVAAKVVPSDIEMGFASIRKAIGKPAMSIAALAPPRD